MAISISVSEDNGQQPFLTVPALELSQPFGKFYVAKIKARDLLKVAFVDELRIESQAENDNFSPAGSQRHRTKTRLREISNFIDTTESAFPNAIILAANYDTDGNLVPIGNEENKKILWRVDLRDDGCHELIIPTDMKLANVIDGQHRLWAFEWIKDTARFEMELLCSIYLDLPTAYQGYLFATINFNQKSVNKSLAYQLYGLTGDEAIDTNPDTWAPDRTAVFLSRRLTVDIESPFYKRIIVGAQNEYLLYGTDKKLSVRDWRVSTATIVDGLLKLFSKKPKNDRNNMFLKKRGERSRSALTSDGSPLRKLYLNKNDLAIYTVVKNYFSGVENTLWNNPRDGSYITKTVGIQALFEVLLALLESHKAEGSMPSKVEYFLEFFQPAASIDFSQNFFRQASGIGKTQIKNALLYATKLITEDDLPAEERSQYLEYIKTPEEKSDNVATGAEAEAEAVANEDVESTTDTYPIE